MKLAEHYGHKPVEELPMLFQRILSNCTLDWFRRQKTQKALFSTMSDLTMAAKKRVLTCWKLCTRPTMGNKTRVQRLNPNECKPCVRLK